jgi:hypothetical protein
MAKTKTPMPKKWIIIVTIIIVAAIVAILLTTIKPPELTLDIDMVRLDDDTINVTLKYTAQDINITPADYKVRIIARRTVGETEEKKTLKSNHPLPVVEPQTSASQTITLEEVSGFTDLNVDILKSGRRIIFKTARIPIA